MRYTRVIVLRKFVVIVWDVDQLQDERPPCDDSAPARQKISSDDVFEHGRFAGGLGANNDLHKRE
jgi:hypothetical protein